jgi:hypothetical protein
LVWSESKKKLFNDLLKSALRAAHLRAPWIQNWVVGTNGPIWTTYLALVHTWTGERDKALDQLETVATIPKGPTYGGLLLNPCWDSLRGDPRFDKIVAAAKAASR